MTNETQFDGDFGFLPFRAHLVYGEIPTHPIDGEFELAVSQVEHNPDDAAAHWRLEAIRERRLHPGAKFEGATLKVINVRVAARLIERSREVLSPA